MESRKYRIRPAASLMTSTHSIGGSYGYPAKLAVARRTWLVFSPEARLPNQLVLLETREAESDSRRPTRRATSFNGINLAATLAIDTASNISPRANILSNSLTRVTRVNSVRFRDGSTKIGNVHHSVGPWDYECDTKLHEARP